jgi:NAD(P)-dependent dehydrogenase (short-subunit alcohol dehydrogenase family)
MADRTALVVGASRGIGLGLVKELAGRGWRVIATWRGPGSDKGLKAFADASGGRVRIETADVEDPASIEALAGRLEGETLDLLFVNAGITGAHGAASGWSAADVAKVFMTNTVGPIHMAEALKGRITPGTGVLALMTSGLGSVASDFFFGGPSLYAASKAALNKMTRAIAMQADQAGGQKLTVLSMSPGWVRTDMGGPNAPVSIEDSAKGLVDVIESKAGSGQHGFYGHDGAVIAW